MKAFERIDPANIDQNPFDLIDKQWFLLTAGKPGDMNMMTASWGTMGILWHRPVVTVYVRPQRFTYNFMESNQVFSMNFLPEEMRDVLNFCGSKSGRDYDKVTHTGLQAVLAPSGGVVFRQSELSVICRKLYHQDIDPVLFKDQSIEKNYPSKDYHRAYIGEIIECWRRRV